MTTRPRAAGQQSARLTAVQRYRPPLTEEQWKALVMDFAGRFGWLCTHVPPSLSPRGRHITATSGTPGLPDLILLHPRHGPALAELKTDTGAPTPQQRVWIAAGAMLWRPRDRDKVVTFLRGGGWTP